MGSESWNVVLSNIELEDEGRYQCQVGATEDEGSIRSDYALIEVLAQPQPPVISVGPELTVREGEEVLVKCISEGGKPMASIKWWMNSELISEGIQEEVPQKPGAKDSITVSYITLSVDRSMSKKNLICEAGNGLGDPSSVKTSLTVEHKPELMLTVNKEVIYEGDKMRVSCEAEGHPNLFEYHWKINDKIMREAKGAKELVLDVTRDSHEKSLTCMARNTVGLSQTYQLNVRCKFL